MSPSTVEDVAADPTDNAASGTPATSVVATFLVGALTVITAALALSSLTDQSIWVDEAFTVGVATAPAERFAEDLAHNGANMSMYLVFMRGWLLLGDSDWWLRLPSVLFTAACVPAFYLLARQFVRARAAVIGAAMVSVSGPLFLHAQEARSYPLTCLLVIVSWYALVRLEQAPSATTRRWYVVVATATVYAHIIALLFVASQLLWLVATRRRDAFRLGMWIAVLVTPQLVAAFGPDAHEPTWIPETTVAAMVGTVRYLSGTGHHALAPLAAAICLVAGYLTVKRGTHLAWAPVSWVAIPVIGLLAVSELSPMLQPRYLIMAIPGAVLLACIALDDHGLFGGALAVGLLALGLPGTAQALDQTNPDWRAATDFVLDQADEDDAIMFLRSRHLVEHYWNQAGRPTATPTPLSTPQEWGPVRRNYRLDVGAARTLLERAVGVWLVERNRSFSISPEEDEVLAEISTRPVVESWSMGGGSILITLYGAEPSRGDGTG